MSNFDFMDNPKFLSNPACAQMYRKACMAERVFCSWRVVCAVYTRQALEDFCAIVSKLKNAEYPEKNKFKMLGWYWCGQNRKVFIQLIGLDNFNLITKINSTTRSYIHGQGPVGDDCYPDLLENLYRLLLWLYKELGLSTTWGPNDFNPAKIPTDSVPAAVLDSGGLEPTPERTLRQLKKAFPNCNAEGLCNVERDGDRYIIRDLQGNKTGELPAPEALEYSQAEVRQLQSRMDGIKQQFDGIQEEQTQLIQDKEDRIHRLEEVVRQADQNRQELTENQMREIDALRKEIRRLESAKEEISESYREKLQALGAQYDALDDKYQALLTVEEQRDALRLQVRKQMERQATLVRDYSQKQDALLAEVADTRRRLEEAQKRIQETKCSEASGQALITQLQRKLKETEQRLREAQEAAKKREQQYQKDMENVLRQRSAEAAEIAAVIKAAQAQDAIRAYDCTDQAGGYLQIANQSLAEIDKGITLYSGDVKMLRQFFKQVKSGYERQINDLNARLAQRDSELREERRRSAKTMEPVQTAPSWKKRMGRLALAACLLLVLGLPAYTAVNQWRLGNLLASIPGLGDANAPKAEDGSILPDGRFPDESGEPEETESPTEPALQEPQAPPEGLERPEKDIPKETAQMPSKEEQTPAPNGGVAANPSAGAENAEAILGQLQNDTEAARPPEDFLDIPGLSSKLVEELDNMDWQSTKRFRDSTRRDNMTFVGTTPSAHYGRQSLCKRGYERSQLFEPDL